MSSLHPTRQPSKASPNFHVSCRHCVYRFWRSVVLHKAMWLLRSSFPIVGKHQPFMGLLVTVIIIPLIKAELLILLAAQRSKEQPSRSLKSIWLLQVVSDGQFIVQKLIQVAVYLWLRKSRVRNSYNESAQFLLQGAGFFNFMQQVDAQVNLGKGVFIARARLTLGNWFRVPYQLYKTFVIDCRLLCSLLFLEHSIQITNETHDPRLSMVSTHHRESYEAIAAALQRNRVYCRLFLLSLSSHLWSLLCPKPSTWRLYACCSDFAYNSLCILGCGLVLLVKNKLDFGKRDQDPKEVKIMVSYKK